MLGLWGIGKERYGCKDLIIEVLSAEFPLAAKDIYKGITRSHKITYQAVHKFAKELVNEGVLVELNRKYLINLKWLNNLNDFSSRIRSNYLNIKELDCPIINQRSSLESIEKYKENLLEELKDMENKPYLNVEFAPMSENNTREKISIKKHILSILAENRFNPVLILGDSGAGKTILANKIAFEYVKRSRLIPVIIRLKDYKDEELPEIVMSELSKKNREGIAKSVLEILLKEGSFIIIFDGLNEIENQEEAAHKINNYASNEYKKNQFIVTCRSYNDPKKRLPFTAYTILPLSRSLIELIAAQKNKKWIIKELNMHKKLFSLCRNPLIFSMLLNLENNSKFNMKADIYSYFINEYLSNEIKNAKSKDSILNDSFKISSYVAYQMNVKSVVSINNSGLYRMIDKYAKESRIPADYTGNILSILLSSGILRKTDSNEYAFMHQSFQEYFASLMLDNAEARRNVNEPSWHDTIIFYSDAASNLSSLINLIHKKFKKTDDHRYLFLAARCCIGKNPKEKKTVVESMLKIYNYPDKEFYKYWHDLRDIFQSWHDREVSKALEEFFLSADDKISPRLVNVLHHSDNVLMNSDKRMEILEKVMKKTKNKHLLYSIIEVMGFRKNVNVIGNLIRFLSSDDPILRCQTVWSLEQMKEKALFALQKKVRNPQEHLEKIKKDAVEELIKLMDNEEEYIKGHALIELSRINSNEAMPFITKFLDEKPFLRYHATYAMQNIEDSDFIFTYQDKKDGTIT